VQVIEADGERAYMPRPDLYQRTLALVKVDEADGYPFDVFGVRGGSVHDWMLHACPQNPRCPETYLLRARSPAWEVAGVCAAHLSRILSPDEPPDRERRG
jgi:hypothetical protein